MNVRILAAVLCGWLSVGATAQEPPPQPISPEPQMKDLGGQRYRIGSIIVDRAAGSFTVPATVLRDEPPIEFLVATRGGYKTYESVLEADADAYQFNLACLLIGLDPEHTSTTVPQMLSGDALPEGDRVAVEVSWEVDGNTTSVPGARLLAVGDPPVPMAVDEWVYFPADPLPDGRFLPHESGTVIGVVHKGESLIEHRQGIGVGNYGSVLVNREVAPPVGTAVTIEVRRLDAPPP